MSKPLCKMTGVRRFCLYLVFMISPLLLVILACQLSQASVAVTKTPTKLVETAPVLTPTSSQTVTSRPSMTASPTHTASSPPTQTPSHTPTPTLTRSLTPSNTPTPTMTPTPIQTLTPSITPEPTTGDIHGFVRYACNDQLVYTSHHFAIFESGEEWSLATTVVNVSGEFWFRYLAPGWYDVYEYMITNNTGYDYGVKRSVNVKAGQTSEITMYTEKCPLLNLVYPIGGEMISETRPVFQWQPYDVGSSYQVRVEEVGQEGGLMLNEPTLLTYKESDFELEPGKTYQWYVCVLDPTIPGCKEASLFETFQVEEP